MRQLQRQIGSRLYERTGLSTDKKAVIERARLQEPQETITDLLRDPCVLEFAGLSELPAYSENQLETALLDHLQRFLLELGHGFCFEARQFSMTEGRKHHRVDLVFFHRLLRCHVLIDLKIRAFQPADAGQMNFYLNWFKTNMMAKGDEPPVGILLCSDKKFNCSILLVEKTFAPWPTNGGFRACGLQRKSSLPALADVRAEAQWRRGG